MVHRVSPNGIVGLGALGQAMDHFVSSLNQSSPGAILFCTKAFDLEQALGEHVNQWPEKIPFVIMCNGFIWPVVKKLSHVLGSRPLRIGMTTIGSTIGPQGDLKIFSDNTITAWGNWGANSQKPLQSELDVLGSFPNSSWQDDIRPKIRQKWILNVVINTLGGAYRLPSNSHVRNHHKEAENLLREAYDLSEVIFENLPQDTSYSEMQQKLWDLVQATGGNENSMAKDVRLARRTESDFLAGIAINYHGYPLMKHLHHKIIHRSLK